MDMWFWARLADRKLFRPVLQWRNFPFKYYRLRGYNCAVDNIDIRHFKISWSYKEVFTAEESEVSVWMYILQSIYSVEMLHWSILTGTKWGNVEIKMLTNQNYSYSCSSHWQLLKLLFCSWLKIINIWNAWIF